MIQPIVSVELPADETLQIQKHRIVPQGYIDPEHPRNALVGDIDDASFGDLIDRVDSGEEEEETEGAVTSINETVRKMMEQGRRPRRVCIVTGIHGDELEGQYVAYELARRIEEHADQLTGIVDIYPAMNPMGIDTIIRGLPDFDLDMNRTFPGDADGDMYEYVAERIVQDLEGADLVVDIHASNIYLTEIPQIRINVLHEQRLLPLAATMNVDFVWIHENATVLKSTLAYTMNSRNVPTLVVEMGVGMRITKEYGDQLVDGILRTMQALGMWEGETPQVRKPIVSNDPDGVDFLNAPCAGVFVKAMNAGTNVKAGDLIGTLIDPLSAEVLAEIRALEDGWLFTIREYPVVQEGSLLGRILKGVHSSEEDDHGTH